MKAQRATRLGAAAFVLGLTLAGPQAVAGADDGDGDSSAGPANTAPAADGHPARSTRHTPAPRTARTTAPRATAPSANRTPKPAAARRAETAADTAPVVRPVAPAVGSPTAPVGGSPDGPASPSVDAAAPQQDSAQGTQAADLPQSAAVPAPAARVATVAIAAAAATTDPVADLLGGVLAPVQAFFEGIGLLVQRTFFNQAPSVTPVQLTGQSSGPITGTVGAVDPEGDPLTYSVTAAPVFGTVTVAADGSYTYTPGADFAGTDAFTVSAADSGLHINLLNPFRPAYTLGSAVVTQGLAGPRIQFEFLYAGGALLWSQEARAALESSAAILGSYFVVSSPVTLTYSVTGELSPLSGTLASASSDIISSRSGFFPTVVQQKIIAGVDVNGSAPDGTITWNFGNPWAYGATVDNGQYDFQSVALHELVHTFGFLSNVSAPGTNDGTGWTAFDGFLVTSDGASVINGDYTWNATYDTNLNGGDGGLYFGGPAAVAAYGGPVPLFSPSPYQGGSSLSHLDDMSFYGRNEQLMNARVSQGKGIRTLSTVETAILTDLGYTVVPGPGASVTLLFGIFLLRRRRD